MTCKIFVALLTVAASTVIASSAMAMEDACRIAAAPGDAAVCDYPAAHDQALIDDPVNQPMARGRVVAVDRASGKVTLEHKPIPRLHLEGGTMIFRVENPATLLGLSPGAKIRFEAERDGRNYVVTRIENTN